MEINFLTAEFHKAKPECALHKQLCIVFTLNQASSGGDKAYVRMYIGYMQELHPLKEDHLDLLGEEECPGTNPPRILRDNCGRCVQRRVTRKTCLSSSPHR